MKWWIVLVVGQLWWTTGWAWGSDKVLLREVSAITLYQGQMTTGRRSSPVSQLKCLGGTAGCNAFTPSTVQCRNVGYDGHDVQWECKTDMDDSYGFGKIQVTCEGYEYPEDPYILKGSCGLEYTIDLTKAGKTRNQNYGGGGYNHSPSWNSNNETGGGWLVFFVVVFGVVFLIWKMAPPPSSSDDRQHQDPRFRGDQRPHSGGGNPPTYGFKPEYSQSRTPHSPPPTYSDATHTGTHYSSATNTDSGSSVGGFWSGLGLGTVGGYLFGSRRNRGHYHNSPGWGNSWGNGGWGNSWGNGGWGNSWGNGGWGNSGGNRGWGNSWGSGSTTHGGRSSSSSGTSTSRTASGFGGTSRR